jgi:hypothetical protein
MRRAGRKSGSMSSRFAGAGDLVVSKVKRKDGRTESRAGVEGRTCSVKATVL